MAGTPARTRYSMSATISGAVGTPRIRPSPPWTPMESTPAFPWAPQPPTPAQNWIAPTGDSSARSCPSTPSGGDNVTPKILLGGPNGTDITNTTQSVVVGQQIVLYGSYGLPSGATVQSQGWTLA